MSSMTQTATTSAATPIMVRPIGGPDVMFGAGVPIVTSGAPMPDRREASTASISWAMQLLEQLAIGVVLLGAQGRIRHTNRAASAILSRTGAAWLDDAGLLRLRPSRLARDLAKVIAELRRTGGARSLTIDGNGDTAPLAIVVTRSDPAAAGDPDAAITLLLVNRQPVVQAEVLAERYGLTPAEAAVLHKLVLGHSVTEIAAKHGVSVSTVRSQLKTLLGKTRTRRQAAMVGKVLADSCALLIAPR
jgi:DNA-binding CsgD family transcriptional regulator